MRLSYTLFVFLFTIGFNTYGQDPVFSQSFANKLNLNPAFAGANECPRFSLTYRNEWPSLPNSYITYSASFDQEVNQLRGGIGLNIMYDHTSADVWNNLYISGVYSYSLRIFRKVWLKAGIMPSFIQKSVDVSDLKYGDMIDRRNGFVLETNETVANQAKNLFDVSSGVLLYTKLFYLSVAVYHITEPNESIIQGQANLNRRYTAAAGYTFKNISKENKIDWSPNIMYSQQGEFSQLSIGNYFNFNSLILGFWTRLDDSFIFLVGLDETTWQIGYSYDLTTSSLRNRNSGGSHEISFTFKIPCSPAKKRFKTVLCPAF